MIRRDDPWADLVSSPGSVLGRRVEGDHCLPVYWAIDHSGAPGLFFKDLEPSRIPRLLPNPRGVAIRVEPDGDRRALSIFLQRAEDREVFASFCRDVLNSSANSSDCAMATQVVFARLAHWQSLLSRARLTALSEQEIRGLFAELWFLESELIPTLGIAGAVRAWVAPDQHPQDFALPQAIVEVKSKLSGSAPTVRISSLAQLEENNLPLYLYVAELTPAETDQALSLNALANRICVTIESVESQVLDLFSSALGRRGYAPLPRYDELKFLVPGFSFFAVADGFPRLTRSAIDPRIAEAAYAIELTSLEPFKRSVDSALSKSEP